MHQNQCHATPPSPLDLFEETAELKILMLKKDKIIKEKQTLLYQKESYRTFNEEDNQEFRNQIAYYEKTLADTLAANAEKDEKLTKLGVNLTDQTAMTGKLTKKVQTARSQSTNLKNALTTGFAELEKSIGEAQLSGDLNF